MAKSKGSDNTILFVGLGVAVVGAGAYFLYQQSQKNAIDNKIALATAQAQMPQHKSNVADAITGITSAVPSILDFISQMKNA